MDSEQGAYALVVSELVDSDMSENDEISSEFQNLEYWDDLGTNFEFSIETDLGSEYFEGNSDFDNEPSLDFVEELTDILNIGDVYTTNTDGVDILFKNSDKNSADSRIKILNQYGDLSNNALSIEVDQEVSEYLADS